MLLGIPQAVATILTILLFYVMDFSLIRRYDRQRQASGSGRAWDFAGDAKREEDLRTRTLHGYAEYAQRTPRFLPRAWRRR